MFKAHSWYFRNTLVRANYSNMAKGIEPTTEYLQLFLRNLLFGESNELKNRHLHIRWHSEKPQNDVSRKLHEGLSIKETAVVKAMMADKSDNT